MVYTLTLNPALDHIIFSSDLGKGKLNRMNRELLDVGGKGINVSAELSELDVKSRALGFVAGFTGYEIERRLQERGIETDFVWLEKGMSRINVKLINYGTDEVTQTAINSEGPDIPDDALKQLFEKLGVIDNGDVLVLSGSVPNTLQNDIYEYILEYVSAKDVKVAVDIAGELLTGTLRFRPFVVKTSRDGLAEIFGETPSSKFEVIAYAKLLKEMGARNVLVSMGDEGGILLDEGGKLFYCGGCRGKVRNTVGAGDAMLAGFLSGSLDNDTDVEYALMLGTAAGGATAFSDGLAKKDSILDQMKALLKDHAKG